jgi:hypothetical protein
MPILGKVAGSALSARAQRALTLRNVVSLGRDVYQPGFPAVTAAANAERVCGAPSCNGGWTLPWKSRRRPIFEQEWGCTACCLTRLVEAAVRRETGEGVATDSVEPHRHRVPLGLVLLAQGWISHPQLQQALEAQRASGRGRIGDWLTQRCGIPEERITRGLGAQWNRPVLTLDGFSAAAMALVMPKRLLAEFGQIPLRMAGSSLLYLAFEERMDASVSLGLENMSGLTVESGLLTGRQFEAARTAILEADGVPVHMKLVSDRDALTAGIVRVMLQRQPVATRLVRVHQYYWLRMWLETGATQGVGGLPPGPEDVEDYLFLVGPKSGSL